MKILSFFAAGAMCAALLSSAAMAQDNPPQRGPTLLPDPAQAPAVQPGAADHEPLPSDSDDGGAQELGFEPMFLEIGEGEQLSFPRPYGQTACADEAVRKIFRDQAEEDFLATLRCWSIPQERSSDFVQVLDQAVAAAGWEHAGGAGMQTNYTKGGKRLDVLIFGFDQFGDPADESDDAYVGYLFGVYDADE